MATKEEVMGAISYLVGVGGYKLYCTPPTFQGGEYTVTAEYAGIAGIPANGVDVRKAAATALISLAGIVKSNEAGLLTAKESNKKSYGGGWNKGGSSGGQASSQASGTPSGRPNGQFVIKPAYTKDTNLFNANKEALKAAGFQLWSSKNGGDNQWYGDRAADLPVHLASLAKPINQGAAIVQAAATAAPAGSGKDEEEDDIPF